MKSEPGVPEALEYIIKQHGMESLLTDLITVVKRNNKEGDNYINLLTANLETTLQVYQRRNSFD